MVRSLWREVLKRVQDDSGGIVAKPRVMQYYQKWLLLLLGLIVAMVALGGYTRLTDSGLSITEWKLFTGILPPFTKQGWQELFYAYQQIPQFKEINFMMDVDEFKRIFWLEYLHRLLGRMTGLSFVLPALYFLRKIELKQYSRKIYLFVALVILQGCMGWFMVASGLSELTSVSHFRLAAHLILAFILFSMIAVHYVDICGLQSKNRVQSKLPLLFLILLTIQIIYGAFVAGLDAGLIYNSYPMMGEKIYPSELLGANLKEIFLENRATIQFVHRIIALSLVLVVILMWFNRVLRETKQLKILTILLFSQFLLGILTLVTVVNIHIAILHQLFALLLFAFANIMAAKFRKSSEL